MLPAHKIGGKSVEWILRKWGMKIMGWGDFLGLM